MSTWTIEEVRELMDENGGGNDAARHVWLSNAPACGGKYHGGVRPKEGDRIDLFKQFVIDCYEQGKFKSSEAYAPQSASTTSSKKEVHADATNVSTGEKKRMPTAIAETVPVSVAKKEPANQVDLLDEFTSFDPFGPSVAQPNNSQSASGFSFISEPQSSQSTFDPFAVSQPSSTITSAAFDPFDTSSSYLKDASNPSNVPVISRTSSLNDVISQPILPAEVPVFQRAISANTAPASTSQSFDPFGNDFLIPQTTPSAASNPTPITNLGYQNPSVWNGQPNVLPQPPMQNASQMYGSSNISSGLAISGMGAFVQQPPVATGRPMGPPPSNYSAPLYQNNRSTYSNFSSVPVSSAGMYSYPGSAPKTAPGAFDFVDAELKASMRR